MVKKKISQIQLWKGWVIRAFAIFGFSICSNAIITGYSINSLIQSATLSGIYLFAEATKYYQIDVPKKTTYKFLVF